MSGRKKQVPATPDERIAILREVMAEAGGMIKDLDRFIREGNALIDRIEVTAHLKVQEMIGEAVDIELKRLGEQTKAAIKQTEAGIEKRLTDLVDMLLGAGPGEDNEPTVMEMARAYAAIKQIRAMGKNPGEIILAPRD